MATKKTANTRASIRCFRQLTCSYSGLFSYISCRLPGGPSRGNPARKPPGTGSGQRVRRQLVAVRPFASTAKVPFACSHFVLRFAQETFLTHACPYTCARGQRSWPALPCMCPLVRDLSAETDLRSGSRSLRASVLKKDLKKRCSCLKYRVPRYYGLRTDFRNIISCKMRKY